MIDLIFGFVPEKIHVHLRRHDIPEPNQELRKWLHKRQVEKDALMKHFDERGCFPDSEETWQPRSDLGTDLVCLFAITYLYYLAIRLCACLGTTAANLLVGSTFGFGVIGIAFILGLKLYDNHFHPGVVKEKSSKQANHLSPAVPATKK